MKNLKVKDIMTKKVIKAHETDSIVFCSQLMRKNNIGFLPILNKCDEVIGVITDRDIVLNIISKEKDIYTCVKNALNENIIFCSPNDDISFAITKMADNQIKRLIIKEKNTIKGVLSVSDLLKHKNLSIYILDLLKEIYNIQSDVVLFKDISSDQPI